VILCFILIVGYLFVQIPIYYWEICDNKYILSVEFILGLMAKGWPEKEILDNYPVLTREILLAIFSFAKECARLGDR